MGALYHLVPEGTWRQCVASQRPYLPATYEQDGFTHLTEDPTLLLGVANNFYSAREPWQWLCLQLDRARLSAEVRFEPAAPVGDTQPPPGGFGKGAEGPAAAPLFPHLYGPIDFQAVVKELAVHRDPDGTFVSIEGVQAQA